MGFHPKSFHQKRVEKFMGLAQQELPLSPTIPSHEVLRLRAKLILEEALETVQALGFEADVVFHGDFVRPPQNLVGILDGCADLSVVTIGTLSACGVPDIELLELVDANNLAKFGPGGYRRDDGKWIKPPGHKAPDIAGLLEMLK